MPQAISLGVAPAVGYAMEWVGVTYTVAKSHSLTLRDGTRYAEITWVHACPDCGAELATLTGLSRRSLPRRCAECNGPDDKDALERRAYTRQRWLQGMENARARKRSGKPAPEKASKKAKPEVAAQPMTEDEKRATQQRCQELVKEARATRLARERAFLFS